MNLEILEVNLETMKVLEVQEVLEMKMAAQEVVEKVVSNIKKSQGFIGSFSFYYYSLKNVYHIPLLISH